LSWGWIAVMATASPLAGTLAAIPVWRARQMILGNIVGTLVIFGTAVALIMREHVVLDRATQACLDAGFTCWPVPSAFTRFAIYAFLGLIEVFGLFAVSLRVEQRIRDRDYAPEWR
jgi:hypothetical protein